MTLWAAVHTALVRTQYGAGLTREMWGYPAKSHMPLAFDAELPLLGIYPTETLAKRWKNVCRRLFIAELFLTAEDQKHGDDWINYCACAHAGAKVNRDREASRYHSGGSGDLVNLFHTWNGREFGGATGLMVVG